MLTEKQFDDYAKELEKQQYATEAMLKEAKKTVKEIEANLHGIVGARQAVAHLIALNTETEKAKNAEIKEVKDETEDSTR